MKVSSEASWSPNGLSHSVGVIDLSYGVDHASFLGVPLDTSPLKMAVVNPALPWRFVVENGCITIWNVKVLMLSTKGYAAHDLRFIFVQYFWYWLQQAREVDVKMKGRQGWMRRLKKGWRKFWEVSGRNWEVFWVGWCAQEGIHLTKWRICHTLLNQRSFFTQHIKSPELDKKSCTFIDWW